MKGGKEREKLLTHEEVEKLMQERLPLSDSTQIETMRYAVQLLTSRPRAPLALKERLLRAGLKEFEAVQVLNAPPKKMLDLYVIVEEMEERLAERETEEILEILKPYTE